jgi:hypothetical protein
VRDFRRTIWAKSGRLVSAFSESGYQKKPRTGTILARGFSLVAASARTPRWTLRAS